MYESEAEDGEFASYHGRVDEATNQNGVGL